MKSSLFAVGGRDRHHFRISNGTVFDPGRRPASYPVLGGESAIGAPFVRKARQYRGVRALMTGQIRGLFGMAGVMVVVICGCNSHQQSQHSAKSVPSRHDGRRSDAKATLIPSDVSFSVIDSETIRGIKRSLVVRLNKGVSEETLRAIALELKARDSRHYDHTFMSYYVDGMAVGSGAWATTHFDPVLKVQINGLTEEDEHRLASQGRVADGEVVGRWLDESPFVAGRITLIQSGTKLFVERTFKDGSSSGDEVVEKRTSAGRRFDKVEGSSTGDHWVINANGDLEIRDKDGLIATAKKIH